MLRDLVILNFFWSTVHPHTPCPHPTFKLWRCHWIRSKAIQNKVALASLRTLSHTHIFRQKCYKLREAVQMWANLYTYAYYIEEQHIPKLSLLLFVNMITDLTLLKTLSGHLPYDTISSEYTTSLSKTLFNSSSTHTTNWNKFLAKHAVCL